MLLYASLQPDARSEAARALLARRGTISVQVPNEFANVAFRKLHRNWPGDRSSACGYPRALCPTAAAHRRHSRGRPRDLRAHGYRLYDALIIAAALEAGCTTLFSEDLHEGQVIDGRLTIRNPFGPGG